MKLWSSSIATSQSKRIFMVGSGTYPIWGRTPSSSKNPQALTLSILMQNMLLGFLYLYLGFWIDLGGSHTP